MKLINLKNIFKKKEEQSKIIAEKNSDNSGTFYKLKKKGIKKIENIFDYPDKKAHKLIYRNATIWNYYQNNDKQKFFNTVPYYLKKYGSDLAIVGFGMLILNLPVMALGGALIAKNIFSNIKTLYVKKNDRVFKVSGMTKFNTNNEITKYNGKRSIVNNLRHKNNYHYKYENRRIYDNNYRNNIINDIENFNFNSQNIYYIEQLISKFKYLNNPNKDIQNKCQDIINYYYSLIGKNKNEVQNTIKPVDIKLNTINNVPVDINDYANIDCYNVISYQKDETNTMSFNEAISIVRDKEFHQEDEWRRAMGVLSSTFGNSKKINNDNSKKLSDFNKTEKLLSFYGRKIKDNTATNEEKLIYNTLIYRLAKCDLDNFSLDDIEDDINDYIIEEADRYLEDIKNYQKKKI